MKKKLAYVLVFIGVSVFILYLFRYKQALDYEKKIPTSATEVIHVNLRAIELNLVIDAIKNPFKYISFKSKSKTNTSLKSTIEIPKNLFLFTNNSNYKNAWFSNVINLKNSSKLKEFLLKKGFKQLNNSDLEIFSKEKFVIAVKGEKALIVYKKQLNTALSSAIEAVFNETEFYKKNASQFEIISNSKSDFVYTDFNKDFLEANFKNGLFELKGTIQSNLFIADTYLVKSENPIASISTKINKNHSIFQSLISSKNQKKFNKLTKLSLDSIFYNWNGSVEATIKSIDTKIDTIVTYKYDDDFNKTEVKSIQKEQIPNATFFLGNSKNLATYFYNTNSIQIIDNDTLFTSIPLYKIYAKEVENGLDFYSKKPVNSNTSTLEEEYKFKMFIALNKYLENPLEFPSTTVKNEYLLLIDTISAKQALNNEVLIQISLKNKGRNFLGQFIKP